ncbi:MAG TPA: DUF5305 family protein [Candidatus Saccharibacteria bacterium]|nr:DUF5305 family protein [Candidatus Saccharibacteria bacterium]
MTLNVAGQPKKRRSFGFVVLGLFLLGVAGVLFYDVSQQPAQTLSTPPAAYSYTINQTANSDVEYFQSSFYGDTPGAGNTAYIAELTKVVNAQLYYTFSGSRSAELTATYSAEVDVKAQYVVGSTDGRDVSNVWSRKYPLIKPTTETKTSKQIVLEPEVSIPFAEYRKKIDQLKLSLSLPLTAEAAIKFVVRVKGEIDGTPIDDIRTSTVSMPLDQPLYTIANKFEKESKKEVVTEQAKDTQDTTRNYERIAVAVAGVLGLAALIFGMRRQIFKSPFQRELDRIYRYHDGIIIRANKPTNLEDRKIVSVQSFDDMLNLEEELKVPIVASPAGDEAMHFIIMRDDVAYMYTLGRVILDEESVDEVEEALPEPEPEVQPPRRRKVARRKIQ